MMAEDFGADHCVLDEVLRHAAADHQQAGGTGLDLDVGQFAEIGNCIEHHVGLAGLGTVNLMLDQAETGAAVHEGRAEDRHIMFISQLDQAVILLAMLGQIFAHLADEGAAAVGAGRQAVGDFVDGVVAILQRFFVDIGVVDAIDQQRAQRIVIRHFQGLIMFVAQAFEEIHVHDGGAGGDNAVDHVAAQQFGIEIHATASAGRAGDDQEDRAIGIGQHLVVDAGGAGEITRSEAHLGHALDDRAGIKAGDVDMLDNGRQQLGLALAVDLAEVGNDGIGGHVGSPDLKMARRSQRKRRPRPGESGAERGKPALAGGGEGRRIISCEAG